MTWMDTLYIHRSQSRTLEVHKTTDLKGYQANRLCAVFMWLILRANITEAFPATWLNAVNKMGELGDRGWARRLNVDGM